MLYDKANPWAVNTRTLVLCAIFGAMVIAMQAAGIGSIPVPNLSGALTTLLIPVILGAVIGGPVVGMFAGLVMGVYYLILFPTFGPLTMIPSRLLFPLLAWLAHRALSGGNDLIAGAAAGAVGAVANTLLTIGAAVLQGQAPLSFLATVVPQAAVEAVAAAIIVPLVARAVGSAVSARGR